MSDSGRLVTMLALYVAEFGDKIKEIPDIRGRVEFSMRNVMDHWMITDMDDKLRVSVGAVSWSYGVDSPESDRIKFELEALDVMGKVLNGKEGSLELMSKMAKEIQDSGREPIGLVPMWRKIVKESGKDNHRRNVFVVMVPDDTLKDLLGD